MASSVTVRWVDGSGLRAGGVGELAEARRAKMTWIDVLEPDEESLAPLAEEFALHPLAIEDCLHYPQRPKLDVYQENVFLIWLAPTGQARDGIASYRELDMFLGEGFLITVHRERLDAIARLAADADCCTIGPEWTAHSILDRLVDGLFPLVDEIAQTLEDLEDRMLDGAEKSHLEALHAARRGLVSLHKVVSPERDVIRGLARANGYVSADAYRYFTDIGDHLARVQDSIETYREVASAAMEIYLSSVSNRMNVVMKQLTVVATIFMPLTLISGIYGMNFQHFPELQWRYGYFSVLGAMVLIAAAMVMVFKRRGWW